MWLSSERDGLRVGRRGSWGRGTSTECYRDTEERHAEGIGTRDVISDCGMWEACRKQHPSRTVSGGSQRKEGAQWGSSQEQKGLEMLYLLAVSMHSRLKKDDKTKGMRQLPWSSLPSFPRNPTQRLPCTSHWPAFCRMNFLAARESRKHLK